LFVALPVVIRPLMRKRLEEKFDRCAENQSYLVEAVTGVQTVKAMALESIFYRRREEQLARYVAAAPCLFVRWQRTCFSLLHRGKAVLSKPIPDTQWSRGPDGLKLTTIDNTNEGFDKWPGRLARIRTSTLYLVVKIVDSSRGWLLYFWPWRYSYVSRPKLEAVPH
jgi:hypothetical protein